MPSTILQTALAKLPVRRGKVRDIYDLGDRLLLVSTDRISAFDWVLPTGIPDKGRVLTQLSRFWFDLFDVPHHLLSCDVHEFNLPPGTDLEPLVGRSMLVRKSEVVPIECVVRGYLSGSGWKEYQESGTVCGIQLPTGLRESDKLPEPIFTPATKAEIGAHDENITFEETARRVGRELAEELRRRSLEIYNRGADYARTRGIIIADTKFEFGLISPSPVLRGGVRGGAENRGGAKNVDLDHLILIDEVLTPDSSRFWPADAYSPGQGQPSFDKQFVRDWLTASGWDRNSQPPELPAEVVARTRAKYIDAFERLTAESFPWK